MNYRHAFHAGNFADVVKHVVLTRIFVHLLRKPTPFRFVDTHAGIGRYDLAGPEAHRGAEWADGVGRLDAPFPPPTEELLAPYRSALDGVRRRFGGMTYPGSPAIAREMLRPIDRAILIEKHPEDGRLLWERFNQVANMKALLADGWSALPGLIPPRERRGLVLIDPPYEEPGELPAAITRMLRGVQKWPTGIFALWYPIKTERDVETALSAVGQGLGASPLLRLELFVDEPAPRGPLAGTGILVVNPPWTLEAEAGILFPDVAARLARTGRGRVRIETRRERRAGEP